MKQIPNKKVAIVTGGSGGIGRAVVSILVKNGFLVANFDRVPSKDKYPSEQVLYYEVNIDSKDSITHGVNSTIDKWKTLTALINCAGIYPSIHRDDYTDELWNQCLTTNLTGPYLLSQAVIPHLKKNNHGYIVNVTSGAAYLGSRDPGYSASKAGLVGLTKSLAKNLSSSHITVNAVAPGPIDTPMSQAGMRKEDVQQYIKNIPLGRFGEPKEVAQAVFYLVSGNADYLTGTTIHVNGGLYLS